MSILNPRVDFAFKKLFGSEENKDILISFINAIVSKKDQVVDVVLLNPYNNKDHQTDYDCHPSRCIITNDECEELCYYPMLSFWK
jgi:hypothetical protein